MNFDGAGAFRASLFLGERLLPNVVGLAFETHVGKVKDGCRTLLYQAGMPPCCWPWAVKYYCVMHNVQQRLEGDGTHSSPPYAVRFGEDFKSERVPFGALIEFLPSTRHTATEQDGSKMGPRTVPGIFIGYYENSQGLTSDYCVIPLSLLADAKANPMDFDSWRITPERSGRVLFDKANPRFPLKPAYDYLRESILRFDPVSGFREAIPGSEVPLFDAPADDGRANSPRGDSASSSAPPLPPPPAPPAHVQGDRLSYAEFSDEVLRAPRRHGISVRRP